LQEGQQRNKYAVAFCTKRDCGCLRTGNGNAYLHVFETVLLADDSKHILLAALLHFASQYQLIEYEVCFLKVEDDIEFADVAVVFVHLFDISMHNLEGDQLVVRRSAASDEEQRSISAIDHFCVCIVVKVSACKNDLD